MHKRVEVTRTRRFPQCLVTGINYPGKQRFAPISSDSCKRRLNSIGPAGTQPALIGIVRDERAKADSGRSFLIADAARLLGVSRRTIYYRIRDGRLRTIRTRCGSQRVLLSSMETLVEAAGGTLDVANSPIGVSPVRVSFDSIS